MQRMAWCTGVDKETPYKASHGAGGSSHDGNYSIAEITPELIEKHVLALSATFTARAMLFLLTENCGVLLQHHFQALADVGCH
jgi:hypothetical protein